MNAFVKYFVWLLFVKCVAGLNEAPDISAQMHASPLKMVHASVLKYREVKNNNKHDDYPLDTSYEAVPWPLRIPTYHKQELELKLSNNQDVNTEDSNAVKIQETLDFDKSMTLKMIIRATDPKGRKATSTIEMDMSMEPGTRSVEPGVDNQEQNPQAPQLSGFYQFCECSEMCIVDYLSPSEDYKFYEAANGSLKFHRSPATWSDARLMCYDEGAELASPENGSLMVAMGELLLSTTRPPMRIFTGVNDLYSKGFFTSLRGTPLSAMATPWVTREQNNVSHLRNCLTMERDGSLLDSTCDDASPYICYKKEQLNQTDICGTEDIKYVFNRVTKSCYKIHDEFLSWQESYATCAREGGYLAILNSDYEAKALGRLVKTEWIWAHIGFTYWRKDLWMTVHGETLAEAGFDSWAAGEPNDYNEERCGCLAAGEGTLVDIDCLDHPRPFICEKSSIM